MQIVQWGLADIAVSDPFFVFLHWSQSATDRLRTTSPVICVWVTVGVEFDVGREAVLSVPLPVLQQVLSFIDYYRYTHPLGWF